MFVKYPDSSLNVSWWKKETAYQKKKNLVGAANDLIIRTRIIFIISHLSPTNIKTKEFVVNNIDEIFL